MLSISILETGICRFLFWNQGHRSIWPLTFWPILESRICQTLCGNLAIRQTAVVLVWLALIGLDGVWWWTAGDSAVEVGRWWERQAWTVGVDLLTLARPEIIHLGHDNVDIFGWQNCSEQKMEEARPLPKRTKCTCKKVQGLMRSAGRHHHKVL